MYLKSIELTGFKSFARKTSLDFTSPITAIVGPNGSGKSNVAEAFRFVLGEQSIKSLRGKRGEDMIWNGSKILARQNRASVKVVFDNSDKFLNVDFDEVVIERVVHRDNANEYVINGSQVRLKDVVELLSSAHIGPSGHHIISQGEADRILNANLKERRIMIEDALGLKIYQYKKQESVRKLEKTRENMEQVESLRREIAPHLRFLKKQAEKIEKAEEIRNDLISLYKQYFRIERFYLSNEKTKLAEDAKTPKENLERFEKEIREAKAALESSEKSDFGKDVISLESRIAETRKNKDVLLREIGRLEGELGAEEKRLAKIKSLAGAGESRLMTFSEAKELADSVDSKISQAEREGDISKIKIIFSEIRVIVSDFIGKFVSLGGETEKSLVIELERLESEKKEIELEVETAIQSEKNLEGEYLALKKRVDEEKDVGRKAEREIFRIMSLVNEERAKLSRSEELAGRLRLEEDEMKRELVEANVLAGEIATNPDADGFDAEESIRRDSEEMLSEPRSVQVDRRKQIERLKIRIEELGAGSGDEIVKEFKEVEQRDSFLEKEIEDLKKSAESLEKLIAELTDKLDYEFKEGARRINIKFSEFFTAMFGGGNAELVLVREKKKKAAVQDDFLGLEENFPSADLEDDNEGEEENEEGIDIKVGLPHKKIKGLEMLSGGERALTSIALLFAVSQVNPPPFIILDETDAALDEANSRKYGNMIGDLSKYSQLVLITHNRETMSHAGVLYGVTMGQDGVSKLLSIRFDEAVKVAK